MRKWLAFMLVMFFAFTLVGCGPKEPKPEPKPPVEEEDLLEEFWKEERPNLNGFTVRIMNTQSALREYDPRLEDYTALDKAAKLAAFTAAEKAYNIKIEVVPYPETAPWGPQRVEHIVNQALIGEPSSEFYIVDSGWIPQLAAGNGVHDVTDYYAKYGQAKMDPGYRQASTYKNRLYGMSNGATGIIHGLYYNYNLLNQLNLESPAKMFVEGRWTYSAFVEYAKAAQAKLPEGGYALAGEAALYWAGMVNAAGIKLADTDNMAINLVTDAGYDAATALREIAVANAFDPEGQWDANNVTFKSGLSLFNPGEIWYRNVAGWWLNIWGEEEGATQFGYVPYPMPDNATLDSYRLSFPGEAVYVMADNMKLPEGVTYEAVYRVLNDIFLATKLGQEQEEDYDAEALTRQGFMRLVDDPYSVEAMMAFKPTNFFFDPFKTIQPHYAAGGLGTPLRSVVNEGADLRESLEVLSGPIIEKLNTIYGG